MSNPGDFRQRHPELQRNDDEKGRSESDQHVGSYPRGLARGFPFQAHNRTQQHGCQQPERDSYELASIWNPGGQFLPQEIFHPYTMFNRRDLSPRR
ncbi:hypothetical protein THIOKS12760017 [Thiocapsa sp. KS1]|nr:hypothetical protein THIOKS12760017 [Thiocapsa sp. KS1]